MNQHPPLPPPIPGGAPAPQPPPPLPPPSSHTHPPLPPSPCSHTPQPPPLPDSNPPHSAHSHQPPLPPQPHAHQPPPPQSHAYQPPQAHYNNTYQPQSFGTGNNWVGSQGSEWVNSGGPGGKYVPPLPPPPQSAGPMGYQPRPVPQPLFQAPPPSYPATARYQPQLLAPTQFGHQWQAGPSQPRPQAVVPGPPQPNPLVEVSRPPAVPPPWEQYKFQPRPSAEAPCPLTVAMPPMNVPHPSSERPHPPAVPPPWEQYMFQPYLATEAARPPTGAPPPPPVNVPRPSSETLLPVNVPHPPLEAPMSVPHPPPEELHPPADVPRQVLPQEQGGSDIPRHSTSVQPRPLFNSRPNVPQPCPQPGSSVSAQTSDMYSSSTAQPRPLFKAPPSRFPPQPQPPVDDTPWSYTPQPGQPTDVPRPSDKPGWPCPQPGPPHLSPKRGAKTPDFHPDRWEWEQDHDDNQNGNEMPQKDHAQDNSVSARSGEGFDDKRNPDYEGEFDSPGPGSKRLGVPCSGSGESERYYSERSEVVNDQISGEYEGEEEAATESLGRSRERSELQGRECVSGGLGREICEVPSDEYIHTSRPEKGSDTAQTSTMTFRPPAFAAGAVEEKEDAGKNEGGVPQQDETIIVEVAQSQAPVEEDCSGEQFGSEDIPGRPGEDLPDPSDERYSGYPDEWYSGRPDERYSGHSDEGRPEEQYSGRSDEGRPDEQCSGHPDEQYSGRHDEHFSGHPDERHSDYGDEHYSEQYSDHPDEHFSGHPDEWYSGRPEQYSDHPHEYFPPDRADERYSGRFDDNYSGRPDGHYSGHFEGDYSGRPDGHYSGRPDGHYSGRPDERYSEHLDERYRGRPNPYRSGGGSYYHDSGPHRYSSGDGCREGMDLRYDGWRERSFHPRDRACLLDRPGSRQAPPPTDSWVNPDREACLSPRMPFREPDRRFQTPDNSFPGHMERRRDGREDGFQRHPLKGGSHDVVVGPLSQLLKAKVVSADRILDAPGRSERPSHIVIILRGLPGAGKSHIAKLIKDKEIGNGSQPPRILSLDAYFVNEVEKMEKDPDTGRRVKKKVEEYEYDESLEPSFRKSLFKTFNKTLEEGFFPMIIVDAVNHKMCHFDRFWSNAKVKGFEVYVAESMETVGVCVDRNIHNRTRQEIEKLAQQWEDTPIHFLRLDISPLLSDSNIDEIEMECATSDDEEELPDAAEDTEQAVVKSRWEDASDDKLDKLDAVGSIRRKKRLFSELETEAEELSLTEYLARKMEGEKGPQKKRVRWADLEAAKEEARRKEIGFVIGSGWSKVSEEEAKSLLLGKTNSTET